MKTITKTSRILSLVLSAAFVFTCAGCRAKVNNKDNTSSDSFSSGKYDSSDIIPGDETNSNDATSDENGGSSTIIGSSNTAGGDIDQIIANNSNSSFKEPVYDLGGRVITIASENDLANATGIFAESVKLTEQKYNCKFKFIHKTDYEGLYQTLINDHSAGTSTYDVIELRGYDVYPNAAMSGSILNLSQVYDFAKDPSWNNEVFGSIAKFKGDFYGIPYTPNEMGVGIWYNRALFRQFNVTDPWEYVNAGKWNFDTFRAVCKKLTNDTNGDGVPDIWAFTAEDPWLQFVYANNGSLFTMTSSGPKYALTSSNSLAALEYVNTLFSDNTVPDGAELGKITSSPFNAMTTGKVAMFPYHARYGAVLESYGISSADIGWVYLPKGPNASSYTTATVTAPSMFVVPQAASNSKELVAAVQDMAAYWDTSRAIKHKVTDKTEELYTALKTSLDANAKTLLYYQAENAAYTYANNYNVGNILQEKVWADILKGKSPKTVVSSYASAVQSTLTASYKGTTVN